MTELDGYFTPWVVLRGCGGPPGSTVPGEQTLIFFQAISRDQYDDFRDWEPPDDTDRIAVNWPTWDAGAEVSLWADAAPRKR
jgi:hypothetical protein